MLMTSPSTQVSMKMMYENRRRLFTRPPPEIAHESFPVTRVSDHKILRGARHRRELIGRRLPKVERRAIRKEAGSPLQHQPQIPQNENQRRRHSSGPRD